MSMITITDALTGEYYFESSKITAIKKSVPNGDSLVTLSVWTTGDTQEFAIEGVSEDEADRFVDEFRQFNQDDAELNDKEYRTKWMAR